MASGARAPPDRHEFWNEGADQADELCARPQAPGHIGRDAIAERPRGLPVKQPEQTWIAIYNEFKTIKGLWPRRPAGVPTTRRFGPRLYPRNPFRHCPPPPQVDLVARGIARIFGALTSRANGRSVDRNAASSAPSCASGCAKTTLLRSSAAGHRVERDAAAARPLPSRAPAQAQAPRWLWQTFALFPHLNVRRHICLRLNARRHDKRRSRPGRRRSPSCPALPVLDRRSPRLFRRPEARVAIARALLPRTGDPVSRRPLSALDAHLRQSAAERDERLHKSSAFLSLYVTHNQIEAFSMADPRGRMNK